MTNLSEFFQGFQNSLAGMSPAGTESPLCVLLTPGRFNETYFEHVFLARYLGLPLVEGQDLTVRDDTVYLKTLQGLRRVHAIYRRLDDGFCDPLELRADSVLGIPGLLGAVRAGKVLMANALGSGVLESAALFGFLPEISKKLLGSPLAMPSVASWWCGEKPALDYVIEHLDELVIKPAFASMRMEPVFGYQVKGCRAGRPDQEDACPSPCLCRPGARPSFPGAGLEGGIRSSRWPPGPSACGCLRRPRLPAGGSCPVG